MRRKSNPITPHETWLELFWSKFDFVLSPVFKYKALVGVLSSSIWVLYQGRIFLAATDRKNITLHSFFIYYFSFMAYANLATSLKRLETELTNITRRHFCSLPFFVLNILLFNLFTFSYRNFFSVICLFWHTVTGRDDTRTRQHTRQGRK